MVMAMVATVVMRNTKEEIRVLVHWEAGLGLRWVLNVRR